MSASEFLATIVKCFGVHNSRLTPESQSVRVSHLAETQHLGQVAQLVEHSTEKVLEPEITAQIGLVSPRRPPLDCLLGQISTRRSSSPRRFLDLRISRYAK
jgi:hypothetical protein